MMRQYREARAATVPLIAAALLATPTPASPQYRGHFVPGMVGMNAGRQVVPGTTAAFSYLIHGADSYRDASGDTATIVGGSALHRVELALAHAARKKFAGARYGAALAACFERGLNPGERLGPRLGAAQFEEPPEPYEHPSVGPGTLYVEPLSLGWELNRGAVRVAYGVVAPWNELTSAAALGQTVSLGATYHVDALGETEVSLNSITEFQGRQRSSVTFGDNTTLEIAAGQEFAMDDAIRVRIGYAGYAQWQFTSDTGPYYTTALSRRRNRVFGFGPEAGVDLPRERASFVVRAETEFGARSHVEGAMVIISVSRSF